MYTASLATLDKLTWTTRGVDAGQTIEIEYACDGESQVLVRRSADRSDLDGGETFEWADLAGEDCPDLDGFDPGDYAWTVFAPRE